MRRRCVASALRSDGFDARALVANRENAVEALRDFARTLVERSGGVALPDRTRDGAGDGDAPFSRFTRFESLEAYEREALDVAR